MRRVATDIEKLKSKLLSVCDPKVAVLEAWPIVCGLRVAQQTRALSCEDKKLQVIVPNKEWQRELSSLADDYMQHLKELLPGAVKAVTFISAEDAGKKP